MHMAPDTRSLYHCARADEHVVPHSQRHVCEGAFVDPAWRAEKRAAREEAVAADGDGGTGCWGGAAEVPADHDFGLDDGFAAEDDVLGADEDGFAGDFVARVLCFVSDVCMKG